MQENLWLSTDEVYVIIHALREKQHRLHATYKRSKSPDTCKDALEHEEQISRVLAYIYRQLSD